MSKPFDIRNSQNFITSPKLAAQIVELASLSPSDLVLEIGPGRGVLTRAIATQCGALVAVEYDPRLARRLPLHLQEHRNVFVLESDFRTLPLPLTDYKVVANIPFNITAEIVARLLDAPNPPSDMFLVMQREAAQRFLGMPRQTLRALLTLPWFDASIPFSFRRSDFSPPPNVDVVLMRFNKRGPPLVSEVHSQLYRDVTVYVFTAWKPTVMDALVDALGRRTASALANEIHAELRVKPSELLSSDWLALIRWIANNTTATQLQRFHGAEAQLRRQQGQLQREHRTRLRSRR